MPDRKMKIGAQKWVTQRVMNRAGSPTSRGLRPLPPKKSRVWSSAMMTMTKPRNRSMELRRGRAVATKPVGRTRSAGNGPAWAYSRDLIRSLSGKRLRTPAGTGGADVRLRRSPKEKGSDVARNGPHARHAGQPDTITAPVRASRGRGHRG